MKFTAAFNIHLPLPLHLHSPLTYSNQFYIEFVNLYSIQSPLSSKHTRIQWFIHVGCRSGAPIVFLNFRLDLHDLHWIHDIFINKSELSEWIKLHTQNTHAQIHSANRLTTIFVNSLFCRIYSEHCQWLFLCPFWWRLNCAVKTRYWCSVMPICRSPILAATLSIRGKMNFSIEKTGRCLVFLYKEMKP